MDEALRTFAKTGAADAFRQIVNQYVNQVYAQAVRQLANPSLADDVTQAVFVLLAQHAARMKDGVVLGGWLHQATRYACLNAARAESRRRKYERAAATMKHETQTQPQASWDAVQPRVDELLERLPRKDRDAVVLRFLENRPMREVGELLGVNEDTARHRVGRAVDRLRKMFAKNGVNASAAGLVVLLEENIAAAAAPPGVIAGAVACLQAAPAATLTLAKGAAVMMLLAKIKTVAAIVALGIGVAGLAGASGLVVAQMQSPPATRVAADQETVDALTFKLLRGFNELDSAAVMECFLFSEPRDENGFFQMLRLDLAQLRLERTCRQAFLAPVGARLLGLTVSDVVKSMINAEPMPQSEGDVVVRAMPPQAAAIFMTRFPEGDANREWAEVVFTYRKIDGVWKWDVRDIGQFVFDGAPDPAMTEAQRSGKLIAGYAKCVDTVTDLVEKRQVTAGDVTPLLNKLIRQFKRENGITGADFLPRRPQ